MIIFDMLSVKYGEVKNIALGRSLMRDVVVLFFILLLFPGCLPKTKAPYIVEQYVLEYPPPIVKGPNAFNESIKVGRFSVAQSFNSQSMVYKPNPFKLAVYEYHRWRVNPGDMVSDYLLRDLRNTGMFRAVFSYRDGENARFVLEGNIEEFLEVDESQRGQSLLSVHIALLDLSENEITKRVLFQKGYRFTEPMKEQTPEGLARGMSEAMARLSGQLLKDIHDAVKNIKQ